MTSIPFTEFPSFHDDYCPWFRDMGGRVDPGANRHGVFTLLTSPDGGYVEHYETGQKAYLKQEFVEQLDSRLGGTSPWNPASPTQREAADED